MADNSDQSDTAVQQDTRHQHLDQLGPKLLNKTEKYQEKVDHAREKTGSEKKPAGGYDATPIPGAPPGYTIRITFHRAENLPFADVPTFSSDPYILATLQTDLPKRHKQDPDLTLRTKTIHRDVNPKWETQWTIAHVPKSGFFMKCRLYDEDPSDHDDRLGNVHVDVDRIDEQWSGYKERKFEIKKRMGSKRAYTLRGCAALFSRRVKFDGSLYISVENLGRSEGEGGRSYTVSPLPWSQHVSPLIGLLAGTKDMSEGKNGKRGTERHNFQAIQMQFQGPIPEHLYHRYVEFRPFVAGMFTSHTLRGRILNHALHHQHARIYNFDGSTKYGEYPEPCPEMTKKFLEFVHFDQGGRIFTYVLTLDGQLRFTETGKEFGIDLLSKHTMHSDVSIYIAFSGEFFIRRLKHPHKDKGLSPDPETETKLPDIEKSEEKEGEDPNEEQSEQRPSKHEHHDSLSPPPDHHTSHRDSENHPPEHETRRRSFNSLLHRSQSPNSSVRSPAPHAEQTHASEEASTDPSHYELIIDNDSGTYRPNAQYLGQLKKFLQKNLPGLRIATLDCQKDAEKMGKLKDEQRERKKKSGKQITYTQNLSSSSLSSSDEEELRQRAAGEGGEDTGVVKSQWNKVKQLAKGDQDDTEKETDKKETNEKQSNEKETTGKQSSEKDNASSGRKTKGFKKESVSTEGKASFDTATEHGDGHFVTPKPSLGFGGLNTFDTDDRPLSRDIENELERRRAEHSNEQPSFGNTTGDQSGTSGIGTVHQRVTSTT